MRDDEVSIIAGGVAVSRWQRVRVHRSCEQVPNSFEVGFVSPETGGVDTNVLEGDPCTIAIGGETVLTGYADVVQNDADANSHELAIAGRGKCADLVDCTAEWPTSVISGETVGGVAAKLCAPYGISVPPPPRSVALPTFGVTLIEAPFTLIEETARYAQMLVYEDQGGDLIFADVGEETASGAIVWGRNVKRAKVTRSAAERFSEYVCYINGTTDQLGDIAADANVKAYDQDSGIRRHRRLGMVLEAPTGAPQQDFATKRIGWERARRAGRARQALVTVPGWRDGGGKLWAPNTRVPLHLPLHGLTGETWVIGDVTYLRDEGGTRTELMLMPPAAFQPQPDLLVDPLVDLFGRAPGDIVQPSVPGDLTKLTVPDFG